MKLGDCRFFVFVFLFFSMSFLGSLRQSEEQADSKDTANYYEATPTPMTMPRVLCTELFRIQYVSQST